MVHGGHVGYQSAAASRLSQSNTVILQMMKLLEETSLNMMKFKRAKKKQEK